MVKYINIRGYSSPLVAIQRSFWPLLVRVSAFCIVISTVGALKGYNRIGSSLFPLILTVAIIFLWYKDMTRESLIGAHSSKLEVSMRLGMLLFILSEVFFFIRFFWSFFDSAVVPTVEIGIVWPPKGIFRINAYTIPLLNTSILLRRGVSLTWAHNAIVSNNFIGALVGLVFTVVLGWYFLLIQVEEYIEASFRIRDGVYGSIFFMATGFHGAHVFIGRVFLLYVTIMLYYGKLTFCHHFSFEAAAWYWHFVDVVWLFLFLVVYVWSA